MRLLWLGIAFVVGAIVLLPLRAVLALGDTGLSAQQVSGSLWSGDVRDAAWRGVPLGEFFGVNGAGRGWPVWRRNATRPPSVLRSSPRTARR